MLAPLDYPDSEFLAMERAVMARIIESGTLVSADIARQYRVASIKNRELSGSGFFTNFSIPEKEESIVPSSFEISVDATLRDGPDVGFTLFVRDGRLDWLEGYTFGDFPWPDSPVIQELEEPPEQS